MVKTRWCNMFEFDSVGRAYFTRLNDHMRQLVETQVARQIPDDFDPSRTVGSSTKGIKRSMGSAEYENSFDAEYEYDDADVKQVLLKRCPFSAPPWPLA